MATVGLRPATAADDEFCFQLHKAAMGEYVAAIWGWDDDVQRGYHDRAFRPGHWQIITVDGEAAGLLVVDRTPGEIYLGRIEIDPGVQGRGVGTQLIAALIAEAGQNGQDLVLDVLAVNHRASALYQRLGFAATCRHGENDIKIRMRRDRPPTPRP